MSDPEASSAESTLPSSSLTGRQRKHVRGLAHSMPPAVRVGGKGLSDAVFSEVERALAANEVVKIKLQQPDDKKAMAAELASRAHAELCGLVGHSVILYRRDPEQPRVELPS